MQVLTNFEKLEAGKQQEHYDKQVFDAIIIGSSPILLIEALYLQSQGKKVAIFEKKTTLGGAWYTKSLWGLSNVEVGCHYIDKGKNNYNFLKKFMNIELEHSPRHVRWSSKGKENGTEKKTNLTLKRKIRAFIDSWFSDKLVPRDLWDLYTSLTKKQIKLVFRSLIQLLRARPYMYPTQGCRAILDALNEKIEANSIKVFYGKTIDYLEVNENESLAVCRAGDKNYLSKDIITGQNANVDIFVNGKPFKPEKELYGGPLKLDEGYIHIVFLVAGEKKQPFTYIDLLNTDVIRRVQDVTPFSKFDPSSNEFDLLICCHVFERSFDKLGGPAGILSHLIEIDLLKPGARMIDYHLDKYPTTGCIPNEELFNLEKKLPDSLRIMRTWDLGIAVEYYYDRWLALITP